MPRLAIVYGRARYDHRRMPGQGLEPAGRMSCVVLETLARLQTFPTLLEQSQKPRHKSAWRVQCCFVFHIGKAPGTPRMGVGGSMWLAGLVPRRSK